MNRTIDETWKNSTNKKNFGVNEEKSNLLSYKQAKKILNKHNLNGIFKDSPTAHLVKYYNEKY